jgi:hypothetical protein
MAGFKGKIAKTYAESKEDWPERPKAPAGAPNVLIILLDDVGFAQLGSYGGLIQTPNLDSLAANGLRYINFHNNRKEYAAPFRFSDKLDKVVFELQPMNATAKNK